MRLPDQSGEAMVREGAKPRTAVLWSGLPAYAYSCVLALARRTGENRTWCGSLGETPQYSAETVTSGEVAVRAFPSRGDAGQVAGDILASLAEFRPEVVVGSGWRIPAWRLAARQLRGQGVLTVVTADTPWLGTVRQTARCVLGRRLLHQMADVMWIPGARGYPVAKLAGFEGARLWKGMYCCDTRT